MMWVFGVLKETFRTITLFITTIVVTDITNIRYLQMKDSELRLNSPRLPISGLQQRKTYLPISGTALDVSGTFLAIRKRKTV